MRRRLFVDANILVRVVVGGEYELLRHLIGAEAYTSTTVLEEASYKIIALTLFEAEGGTLSAYKVRKLFEKGVAREIIESRLAGLNKLAERLNIIAPTWGDFEEAKKIMLEYRLLPNDALIAAMAKHRNIDMILSLDSDFRKIPWLRVVP